MLHGIISHFCGELRVPLDMGQCPGGLSSVPSSMSRLLMCLMGNMELLCTPSRGIGLHLAVSGKSHGFSRVAAGPWHIFSS